VRVTKAFKKRCEPSARICVKDSDLAREPCDKFVAAMRRVRSDPTPGRLETRHNQETARGKVRPPFLWHAKIIQAASEANDDRGRPTQEDAQASLLDRGMEAADDRPTAIAPTGREIVGGQNHVAGTFGRTKQGGERLAES
jgi:hypothetical protein